MTLEEYSRIPKGFCKCMSAQLRLQREIMEDFIM